MKTLLCLLLVTFLPLHAHAVDLTAHVGLEGGKSFPQSNLKDFLIDGTAYRIDLFGGAHLQNIKILSAIGLGLDFTYTEWRPKNLESGFRYKQYQWDMFKLPISLGWFIFEPGFIWMITDIKIPHKGIDQTSIRPGVAGNVGMRIPLFPHFNLRADARAQRVMVDKERTNQNTEMAITGQTYSFLGGVEFYF